MVAASVDMSAERKVGMEETKMSTMVPVDIREIMEITRTTIAAVVSKEDTEPMTISAALLSMLNSMLDIPMTAEYIPAS